LSTRWRISTAFLVSSLSTTSSCAFLHTASFSSRQLRNVKCSTSLYQQRSNVTSSSLDRLTLDDIVQSLKEGKYKKILVVSGAGVSVSAGIPDVSRYNDAYNMYLLTLIYTYQCIVLLIYSFDLQGQDCMTICINIIYLILKLYLMLTVSECIPCISFESLTNIGSITVYRQNPMPFVTLSKEIWPGEKYFPTLTHCFFSLLDKKGYCKEFM